MTDTQRWQPDQPIESMSLEQVENEIDRLSALKCDPKFMSSVGRTRRRDQGDDPCNPKPPEKSEYDRLLDHSVALQQRRLDLKAASQK